MESIRKVKRNHEQKYTEENNDNKQMKSRGTISNQGNIKGKGNHYTWQIGQNIPSVVGRVQEHTDTLPLQRAQEVLT